MVVVICGGETTTPTTNFVAGNAVELQISPLVLSNTSLRTS